VYFSRKIQRLVVTAKQLLLAIISVVTEQHSIIS